MAYRDRFTLRAIYKQTGKEISEITRPPTFKSFENIKTRQFILHAIYDQPLGENIKLKNSFSWSYSKASFEDTRNSRHYWILDSQLNYFQPYLRLNSSLNYCRGMTPNLLLQGYQTTGLDYWALNLGRQFLKGQLSLSLSWFLPINWGTRDIQKKEIQTSYYKEHYDISTHPYQNMLLLRFNFRFNQGKTNRSGKASSIDREKRTERSVDF